MTRFGWSPFLWGLAFLIVAAVVHLVAVLALPSRATDDAFARVARAVPPHGLVVVEDARRDRLPFEDPAMLTAICRFDVSGHPFRLELDPIDSGFLSVGVHSRHGVAFYGLTVRATERDRISLVLMTEAQRSEAEDRDEDAAPVSDLRVTVPEPEGFLTVATPLGDGGDHVRAQDNLGHVRCDAPDPATAQQRP